MKIILDKTSLHISSRKVITGIISLKIGDDNFIPEKCWNDFIVVVLAAWAVNLIYIFDGKNDEVQFPFFDGPFYFVISKNEMLNQVEFFHWDKTIGSYSIDIYEFGHNVVHACRELLLEINMRKWDSDDVKQLELSLKELTNYI